MKSKFFAILFTLMAVWMQGAQLFRNGLFDSQGNLVFYDPVAFRDVTVHLSLIGELMNRFPPTNFAAGGVALKNYHYIFDLILSIFARIPGLSLIDLYFRVIPVFLSVALCSVIYLTTLQLTKKKIVASFAIFFTIFATSFGPIIPFIKGFFGWNHVTGESNIFMTDQIFSMMINPQGVSSLIIYLSIFLSFCWYERSRKIISLILLTVLLGISFGVKAYGGILFAPSAIIASGYLAFKKKDYKPLLATFAGLFLIGLWFFFTIDSRVASLSFAPFWILGKMFSDFDRLNEPYMSFITGKKYILLVIIESIVLLVGSLGLRVLGLLSVVHIFRKIKQLSIGEVFLYSTGLFSFLMPIFFNQTFKAYEVIQFFPYYSLLMGILFTITLFSILNKASTLTRSICIAVVIFIFLAFDKREFDRRFIENTDKIVIPKSEVLAVDYIRKKTNPNDIFFISRTGFNSDYLWFSSLTGRRTVFSGKRFVEQLGIDPNNLPKSDFDYIFISEKLDGTTNSINVTESYKLFYNQGGVTIYKK